MWLRYMVVAVLVLSGCGPEQRLDKVTLTDWTFKGPIRSRSLSSAQIKLVQKGIAKVLKDPASASFGSSYRAGTSPDGEIVVCGFVNGKRFVGMFAKPQGGATEFLPIRVAVTEEQQNAARKYCRAGGIYLPR
jgi:hypothetical protein